MESPNFRDSVNDVNRDMGNHLAGILGAAILPPWDFLLEVPVTFFRILGKAEAFSGDNEEGVKEQMQSCLVLGKGMFISVCCSPPPRTVQGENYTAIMLDCHYFHLLSCCYNVANELETTQINYQNQRLTKKHQKSSKKTNE